MALPQYTSRAQSGQRIRRVDVRELEPPRHYAGASSPSQGSGQTSELRDEDGKPIKIKVEPHSDEDEPNMKTEFDESFVDSEDFWPAGSTDPSDKNPEKQSMYGDSRKGKQQLFETLNDENEAIWELIRDSREERARLEKLKRIDQERSDWDEAVRARWEADLMAKRAREDIEWEDEERQRRFERSEARRQREERDRIDQERSDWEEAVRARWEADLMAKRAREDEEWDIETQARRDAREQVRRDEDERARRAEEQLGPQDPYTEDMGEGDGSGSVIGPGRTPAPMGTTKRRRERISTPHYPAPDSSDRATRIVYPDDDNQVMEEVAILRRRVAEMDDRENKRARMAQREEQRTIPSAEIAQLRTFFQEEQQYQSELNRNPYMRFALGVAQMTNAKQKHAFVNTACASLLDELYDKSYSKNVAWMLDAATRASRILHLHSLDALPAESENYVASDARHSLKVVHRDLSKALDTMGRRQATLNAIKDIMRPRADGSMEEILSPALIICAEKIVDIVSRRNNAWKEYRITVNDVLLHDETMIMLTTAVANDLNFTRLNTTSMPKSRMDRKMAVHLLSQSIGALMNYPVDAIVPSGRNMIGTMGMMAAQNRVGWGGGKIRYSVTGVPVGTFL